MTFEKVKRNQYFDPPTEFPHSSRNHAEDMEDFHLPMDRMHHAHLHDRGIARGLEVSGTIGSTEVVVNPGVAIDGQGRLIVLATEGSGDIGVNPPGGDNEEVDVPVPLTTSGHADQTVYVTIQFSEILRIAEGSGGRREQVPWLRLQPVAGSEAFVDDGTSIILAIAVIDADGNLSELKNQDSALPFRRNLIGETTEELRIRRGDKVGDRVQEVAAGKIGPKVGGGLQVTVPNSGDGISVAKEGGGNFANLELRANTVSVKDTTGNDTFKMDIDSAALTVGTSGKAGKLSARNEVDQETISLDGSSGRLTVGAEGQGGDLVVKDADGREVMRMDGAAAALLIGAAGHKGDLIIRNEKGENTFAVDGNDGDILVHRKIAAEDREVLKFDADQAMLTLGGADQRGSLIVKNMEGQNTLEFDGLTGSLSCGTQGHAGKLTVKDDTDQAALAFDSRTALLTIGSDDKGGILVAKDNSGREAMRFSSVDGDLRIGNAAQPVSLRLRGPDGNQESSMLAFEDDGGTAERWYRFINDTDSNCLKLASAEANPIVSFERRKGNVGIGTASPETKFKVVGGSAKFVTNSGDDPLIISRFSQATATQGTQELRIGVDDGITTMHYINDESRNRIQFRMQNTDTEKGGGRGRNDNIAMTIFGDADGGGISIGGFAKKPGGGSWASTSDRRLKKEIKPLTGALNKLLSLNGLSFKWKEPHKNGNQKGPQVGMVAQDVEKVFPDWVGVDSDGYKFLSIRGFEALTIEGLRELKSEMQTKVAELAVRIGALEEKLKKEQPYESATDKTP